MKTKTQLILTKKQITNLALKYGLESNYDGKTRTMHFNPRIDNPSKADLRTTLSFLLLPFTAIYH
jgi:hypothetical protein